LTASLQNTIEKYDYPDIIFEVVSKFLDIVLDVFKEDEVGVLLVGSTSRGELCWSNLDANVVLYSDIEFMIAVNSESHIQKRELSDRVALLSSSYDLGERFHLDYVVNKWSKLKSLQKKIFIFDSKNTGIDLTEYHIKKHLPDVKKSNLDFKELNDVLLHRMKALINDIPESDIRNDILQQSFVLSIAKNALDITTWLYPYESNELLSGFENRVDVWENGGSDLVLSKYFDKDDFLFLRECISIRKRPSGQYDEMELLNNYITIYEKAIRYCKAMNSIAESEDIGDYCISRKLFGEFGVRRRVAETYKILSNYKLFSLSNLISNILFPRKGKQIKFCLSMIKAILENHYLPDNGNTAKRNEDLNQARCELKKLRRVKEIRAETFSDDWNSLRGEYLMLNKIFI